MILAQNVVRSVLVHPINTISHVSLAFVPLSSPQPTSSTPTIPEHQIAPPSLDSEGAVHDSPSSSTQNERARRERRLWDQPVIDPFPSPRAGAPIPSDDTGDSSAYEERRAGLDSGNIWAPFKSKLDWCFAYWAKTRGPTSSAVTELLQMEGVPKRLDLSFRTATQLNDIVDKQLPDRPKFRMEEVTIGNRSFEIYLRDIITCIRAIYGDAEFVPYLVFSPERHYKDPDRVIRVYSEMNTGKWWWAQQMELEHKKPGATIIPLIFSSDKTQLTVFRNKTAYPVYLTIGNISKDIRRKPSRRAQILVAYLPTAKLDHIKNKTARRRALSNLFHECMRRITASLQTAGTEGVAMQSGDGVWRRCHPIYATFVGDYPEQVLVASTIYGDCPKCIVPKAQLGDNINFPNRDLEKVLNVFDLEDGDPSIFHTACDAARLRPTFHPFWEHLPLTNIYLSITPDILHQLLQGVIKHLVEWLIQAYGAAEIDARCRRMPPNHNAFHFTKGISSLSRVTGTEHKHMCRILLGLILDLPLPENHNPAPLVRATRAALDFVYIAQYPVHSSETLDQLDDALERFHADKQIFIDLGIRSDFNIPKFHAMHHYRPSIELFGTTDNYNTEQTERLHIDFAKLAYNASNHKEYYPQMTTWLERREKVADHAAFIRWRTSGHPPLTSLVPTSPARMRIKMTKFPSATASLDQLSDEYGAVDFGDALADYVIQYNYPGMSRQTRVRKANELRIPVTKVPVFHIIKFWNHDAHQDEEGVEERDAIHVRPATEDKRGRVVPGRFDTGLVDMGDSSGNGVAGARVAQIRAVFQLPAHIRQELFDVPGRPPPSEHLAYVEWFTPFHSAPSPDDGTYRVSRSIRRVQGREFREASIIPVSSIKRSVHLWPVFGNSTPQEWTSFNVLEQCSQFRVNPFLDKHSYLTVY
ncbi:hypothetical protein K488DRAFT_47333 [Vararia minispora EC-137]|uniref:Uncharacterized protein n=1 Tax=Vararia minispora EC-137 TaxID=1314806 RepID=A0ACB8QQ65_9AGAM|nr:hypothetical protein K488DRAFT_47333 [Vararia minispora EC-137]